MGNLPIVIIPAICGEGGPFGTLDTCRWNALSYSSFSMAIGGIFIWTYTYQTVRSKSMKFKELEAAELIKNPNKDLDANAETQLLRGKYKENTPENYTGDTENQIIVDQASSRVVKGKESCWHRVTEVLGQLLEELMAPPTIASFFGFLFGGIRWLRNLIIGEKAPLRVIQDSIQLLGNGTIPCITLLLGGNLTQGMKSSSVKPLIVISVVVTRLIILPGIGFFIVQAASDFGFLPPDPLFHYVLVMQYAMPPAMNISTMVQLFDAGQEECSVILLWSYAAAALTLTAWSTFLMWVLS